LVSKSVTLNDLERCNGRVVCVISPDSVALGPYCVKVVEGTPIHSASSPKNLVFSGISLDGDIRMDHSSEGVKGSDP